MSQAEVLPEPLPAELHLEGGASYSGQVSELLEFGLLLRSVKRISSNANSEVLAMHVGARATLNFIDTFDENGKLLQIPVVVVSARGREIRLEFRSDDEALSKRIRSALLPHQEKRLSDAAAHLDDFRERALRQADALIDPFISDAAERMMDLASQHGNRDRQDALFEAMNILRRDHQEMRKIFGKQLASFFDEPTRPESKGGNGLEAVAFDELNLVDLQDFEDTLTIDRIVREAQRKLGVPMEALTIRFAEMCGTEPMETRLPVHVAQLCSAFQEAVINGGVSSEVVSDLYQFFNSAIVKNLEAYYKSLNTFLRDRGVKPEVEEDLEKHGSLIERMHKERARSAPKPKPAPPPTADLPSEEETANLLADAQGAGVTNSAQSAAPTAGAAGSGSAHGGAASRHFDTPTLYRSVIDALNFRRTAPVESGGTVAGNAGTGGGGTPASSNALASVLSQLQADESVRSELRDQRSVRRYLADHQASIAGLEGTDGFEPESVNQLDLVDNLFSDISVEVDVEPDLRSVVGDLQIPLAKLALLEPQFFADQNHPARGVIDKVTQLVNSSNYPNRALETKVSAIIDNIVRNYQTDSGVFTNALGDLEGLSEQQKKALERNVERVVKTQDGQEKLRKAEKAVDKVLRTRIRAPQAPKPLVDLVDKGWRDLLKLTFVKQGPNSRAWKDYVKTLDLLSLWLMQKQQGTAEDEQMQVERALEAEPLLDMVSQQINEALPTHVEHEPVLDTLREVLAGRAELEYTPVEPPEASAESDPQKIREKVEKLPRLRRWVQRVEDLERGAWLTYRDAQGAKRRMQLAWISEDGDRFIFVNERGQKVADLTGVALARQLSRGVKPPTPSEELPLVDQSM